MIQISEDNYPFFSFLLFFFSFFFLYFFFFLSYLNFLIKYSETSGTIFIINAPSILYFFFFLIYFETNNNFYFFLKKSQAFWRFVKPVIPPNTMKKIHFLGANYTVSFLFILICISRKKKKSNFSFFLIKRKLF